MSQLYELPVPANADPLSTAQRTRLRASLEQLWHDQVVIIIDLAVQRYATDSEELSIPREDRLDAELATGRRALVDTEAALQRLEAGTYGRCDSCDRRMPFEQLELRPAMRFCTNCHRGG
jgi:DnaK suppressor protein